MQEYYLDGNDNKTKSSFYQDINSGIYNNVAIGKVYFDNRLLWTAPKKRYAIINTNALNKIRMSEGDQHNYLCSNVTFLKGTLPESYNIALEGSTAAIYAKKGLLYSLADYAYFDNLHSLSQKIGFGKIGYHESLSPISVDLSNTNIYFNKVLSNNNWMYETFSNTYQNYHNAIIPNTITALDSTFKNAYGLCFELPIENCGSQILRMDYTYANAGGGVEFINNSYQRHNIHGDQQYTPIWMSDWNRKEIGDNVVSMINTFYNSTFQMSEYNLFFGPNVSLAASTYASCPYLYSTNGVGIFPENLSTIIETFSNCKRLERVTVGALCQNAVYSWVYSKSNNINTVYIDPLALKCGSEYASHTWGVDTFYNLFYYGYNLVDASWMLPTIGRKAFCAHINFAYNLVNLSHCCDMGGYPSYLQQFSFHGNNIIDMSYCCFNCCNLIYLSRPYSYNQKVVNMACTYYNCHNLTNDSTFMLESKNLVNCAECYRNCSNLYKIFTSSGPWVRLGGKNLQNIYAMFDGCYKLTGDFYISTENFNDSFSMYLVSDKNININIYIKSNTLTNNSFFRRYGENIWSNNNGYSWGNVSIYYADKHPYYYMYENWG